MSVWLKWPTNTKVQHILFSTCLSFGNQVLYLMLEGKHNAKSEQWGGQWKSRGARTSYQILEVIIIIWSVCCICYMKYMLWWGLLILFISHKSASRVELSLLITFVSMNLKEGMGNSQFAKLRCVSKTGTPCSNSVRPHKYVQRKEHNAVYTGLILSTVSSANNKVRVIWRH